MYNSAPNKLVMPTMMPTVGNATNRIAAETKSEIAVCKLLVRTKFKKSKPKKAVPAPARKPERNPIRARFVLERFPDCMRVKWA